MPFNSYENLDTSIFNIEAGQDFEKKGQYYGTDYINKNAAIAAQMSSEDPSKAFNEIRDNLLVEGTDRRLEDVRERSRATADENIEALSQSILLDTNFTPEEKVEMLSVVKEEGENFVPDVDEEFVNYNLENPYPSRTADEDLANIRKQGTAKTIVETARALEAQQSEDMMKFAASESGDVSTARLVGDVAEVVTIFGQQGVYRKIFESASPEFASLLDLTDYVAVGEVKRKFKEYTDSLDLDSRIQLHQQILDSVTQHLGVISDDNRIEKMFLNQELTDLMNPLKSFSDTERFFDNFVGALDALPVLSIAGSGLKAGMGYAKNMRAFKETSNISNLSKADPVKANEMAKSAISSPDNEQVTDALGATGPEIIDELSFIKSESGSRKAPDGPDIPNSTYDNYKEIFGGEPGVVDYKANKAARIRTSIDKVLAKLTEKQPAIHLSKSRVITKLDGADYEVVIGQTDSVGFQSLGEAHDAARGFREAKDGYEVLARNKQGDLVPEGEIDLDQLPEYTEYFVQVKSHSKYDSKDLLGFEGSNSILVDNGVVGKLSKYLDPSSVFLPEHIREASNVVKQAARYSKATAELLKPFTALKKTPWKQAKVLKALQEGESAGEWLDSAALDTLFESDAKLIKAYEAFRQTSDVIYLEQNSKLFKQLDQKGYLDIQIDDFHSLAAPVKPEDLSGVKVVYDPSTGKMRDISQEEIASLKSEGRIISNNIDLIQETKADGKVHATNYIIHDVNALSELPTYVLNYRAGYIPRLYESPYKVVRTSPKMVINGAVSDGFSKAVGFAPSAKSASRMAKQMEGDPGEVFEAQPTRELLNATEEFDNAYDLYRAHGRMYFSKRGEELPGLNGERTVGNITDSMSRMIASVTRQHPLEGMITDMRDNWMKSYRGFSKDPSRFPSSIDQLIKPANVDQMDEYKRAVSIMERINHLNGQHAGIGTRFWRESVANLSKLIEADTTDGIMASFRNHISKALLDPKSFSPATGFMNIGRSPISALKAATFVKVIALNPLRQVLINLSQMSVYAGVDNGWGYMTSTFSRQGWLAEHSMLLVGMSTRNLPEKNKNLIRKLTVGMINTTAPVGKKVTLKDLDDLTEDFHKSGLMQNIDGHQFLSATAVDRADSTLGSSKIASTAKYAKEYLMTAPINAGKQGFILGETANIATAWLVARNGVRKSNPEANLRSSENLDYISGRASEISYNMNTSGEIAYQKGALSAYFQFFSVQQKAIQALLPEKVFGKTVGKLAGKQFSAEEKARIALIQSGLFGTAGLGLNEVYHKLVEKSGIEIDPETNSAIKGGLVDYMVNGLGEIATGEAQGLKASESLAPISAIGSIANPGGVVDAALKMATLGPKWTDFLGASGNVAGQTYELFRSMHYVGLLEKADLSTPEDYQVILEDSISLVSSGASNYLKAMLYMNLGREYTSKGIAKFKTTEYEQWGKALFGLQNTSNSDVNDIVFETIKQTNKLDATKRGSIERDAKLLYDMVNKFAVRKASGDLHDEKYKETLRSISMIYNLAYSGPEKRYLQEVFQKGIVRDDRLESGELRLAVNLMKATGEGWMTSKDALINTLRKRDVNGSFTPLIELFEREVPGVDQ